MPIDVGQAEYVRDFDGYTVLTDRPAYAEPLHVALNMPAWIDRTVLYCADDLIAVVQGGCASGAYMPAVTYCTAQATMGAHGDAVLEYLDDHGYLEPEFAPTDTSWSGIACHYLSLAVGVWCRQALHTLCGMDNSCAEWEREL